jgi:GT2 family glycosyltransferase/glycosyltransferase involved in cell wall biosynthesis
MNPSLPAAPDLAAAVDVVVPIWQAVEEFGRCLRSLLAHTDLVRHRLLLVLDGPQPEPTETRVTAAAAAHPERLVVLRNQERQGFVVSVNRGMAAGEGDVVLLNSDTEVTAGWLEKLAAAAASRERVATVTPFSNSATICSLPRPLETNFLPAGWQLDDFARLVEERSLRAYPELPTGVGVCLYIRREALRELGLFDASRFGLGYGEESDFCMRASAAGFSHLLDDATFIYHSGSRSFGATRHRRIAAAHRRMNRFHPDYLTRVARFIAADPLRPERERVVATLAPPRTRTARPPARILHVVHGWPPWNAAGTELYAAWLARRQALDRAVTVYARIADPGRQLGEAAELLDAGVRVRLLVRNFDERNPLSRNALVSRPVAADFNRLLDEERPDLVHIHHLAGHAATLPGLARRRGIPIVYQLQDWWAPCARANLFTAARAVCAGPGLGKCSACLPLTARAPSGLLNRALYGFRGALLRRALGQADLLVAGSRFILESYRRLGWLPAGVPVEQLRYGIAVAAARNRSPRPAGAALRFGFIGSLLPAKGAHLAAAAFAPVTSAAASLTIWGDPTVDPAYANEIRRAAGAGAVVLAGRFPEAAKAELLAGLDALIVPSLGLESFGLVVREAFQQGIPVLASRRSALVEAFGEGEGGSFFDPDRPGELAARVAALIADPTPLTLWAARIPGVVTADQNAEEMEGVYRRVLAGRKG